MEGALSLIKMKNNNSTLVEGDQTVSERPVDLISFTLKPNLEMVERRSVNDACNTLNTVENVL